MSTLHALKRSRRAGAYALPTTRRSDTPDEPSQLRPDFENPFYDLLPKCVIVGAQRYDIEVTSHRYVEQESIYGECDFMAGKIRLRPAMRPGQLANTLLHEIRHAIHNEYGLPYLMSVTDDVFPEEPYTLLGTNGLLAFMLANPGVMELIYTMAASEFDEDGGEAVVAGLTD